MTQERYMTIEEVVSQPSFQSLGISNDGNNIAFVKKTADWKNNKYENHVWIYIKNSDKPYPLTTGEDGSTSPLWSPDSKNIAYLSKVGEGDKKKNQIFIKPLEGYTGIQITSEDEGVDNFKWSPDGKGLYYIAKLPLSKEMKSRKENYGDFQYVDKEYQQNCLYYIDIENGKEKIDEPFKAPKDLREQQEEKCKEDQSKADSNTNDPDSSTNKIFGEKIYGSGDFYIRNFDISPKGDKIVIITVPTPDLKDIGKNEMYIYDILEEKESEISINAVLGSKAIFSADGCKICYTRSNKEKEHYEYNIEDSVLEIYDLETEKSSQLISEIDIEVSPICWTSKGILLHWQEKTNYLIGLLSMDGRIDILVEKENSFVWDSAITRDGEHLAYIKATSAETFEIYLDNIKITDESSRLKGKKLSKKEVISWESSDGLEIEGVLSLPIDFDSSKKYPLLLVVHGGPTWASFTIPAFSRYYPIDQFVEKGFIVLEPNYRGSSGYGDEFKKANYRKLGIGDYDDVISGVDALIEKGFVDKDKVGVMGWSQGGYISAFCSTYSDRFKAISVGAGISNWITYYVNTDIHTFTREYLGNNPWKDREIYDKTSPMTYIKSACTPTLIQHGEKDTRVPTPNAYELYQGLIDMGVEAELAIFKGMGHGSEKPGFNRAIMKQNLIWFCHHILGEDMDNFRTL